jgi:hypothetical protein
VNNFLDLSMQSLDDIEAPMTAGEGAAAIVIAFGVGLAIGCLIT